MIAPLYPKLEHVLSPKCAHSLGEIVRKNVKQTEEEESTGDTGWNTSH